MNSIRFGLASRLALFTLFVAGLNIGATPAVAQSTRPATNPNANFARGNLTAWCIVPYDGVKRTPEQRAEMLARIGIRHFAYDWRAQHLPTFDAELDTLRKRDIQLNGVWFPDALNADARLLLAALAKHKMRTQLWVMSGGYTGEQEQRVKAAVDRLRPIADEAAKIGCTLGVYNHNGWLGEPDNIVAVVRRLKDDGVANVGIVYNFSHAYGDLDAFAERFARMLPYLLAVNLNGMSKLPPGSGDAIVPVGQGKLDVQLLKVVRDSGFAGPIGIINESSHDAEARLLDNMDGVDWLLPQLDGKPASERPKLRTWGDGKAEH